MYIVCCNWISRIRKCNKKNCCTDSVSWVYMNQQKKEKKTKQNALNSSNDSYSYNVSHCKTFKTLQIAIRIDFLFVCSMQCACACAYHAQKIVCIAPQYNTILCNLATFNFAFAKISNNFISCCWLLVLLNVATARCVCVCLCLEAQVVSSYLQYETLLILRSIRAKLNCNILWATGFFSKFTFWLLCEYP